MLPKQTPHIGGVNSVKMTRDIDGDSFWEAKLELNAGFCQIYARTCIKSWPDFTLANHVPPIAIIDADATRYSGDQKISKFREIAENFVELHMIS